MLLASTSEATRQQTQQLGVVFGDGRTIDTLKETVINENEEPESRRAALRSLVEQRVPGTSPLLKQLLNDTVMTNEVVRGFAAYEDEEIPGLVLSRYGRLDPEGQSAAITTLTPVEDGEPS